MNILMINKADKIGGAAKVAWGLSEQLRQLGHKVDFFAQHKESASDNVQIISRARWRFFISHLLGSDMDFFQSDYLLTTKEFKQADVVHVHNIHGHYFNLSTLAKIAKLKPIVWTFHDLWPVTAYCAHPNDAPLVKGIYQCPRATTKSVIKSYNQRYLSWRKRKFYKENDFTIVVPSVIMKNQLVGTVLADRRIELIHHGIDQTVFCPRNKKAARERFGLPLDKKIIMVSSAYGRKETWKGWSVLKTLIDKLPADDSWRLIFVGQNAWPTDNKNIINIGYQHQPNDLADLYSAADLLLSTSTAESFSLTIIESMACGLPVVTFPVGIALEAIKHRINGYLAKNGDIEDVFAGISYILSLADVDCSAMQQECVKMIFSDYKDSTMVANYLKLYQSIV